MTPDRPGSICITSCKNDGRSTRLAKTSIDMKPTKYSSLKKPMASARRTSFFAKSRGGKIGSTVRCSRHTKAPSSNAPTTTALATGEDSQG